MGYNSAKKKMKKIAFIVMAALSMVCFSTSCNKSKVCQCSEYRGGVIEDSWTEDTEVQGVKSCSKLEEKYNLLEGEVGVTFKCSKI